MKLVLLHSPLVGPGTWRTIAPLLEAEGFDLALLMHPEAVAGGVTDLVRSLRR